MTGIYKITNKINNHSYIGKSNNIKRRFNEHRSLGRNSRSILKKAFKKYGLENFEFEILEECNVEELNDREIYYIAKFNPEYNRTIGGDGATGHHLSQETKQLLREKGKLQWQNKSQKEKEKIITNNLKGVKVGHSVSKETREKLRNANLGKKQSKETIEKRKQTMKEKGYIITNESHQKPIICIETGEVFKSLKEATEKYNLTTLCGHLKGRYKTCKGKHYKYCSVTTMADECKPVG